MQQRNGSTRSTQILAQYLARDALGHSIDELHVLDTLVRCNALLDELHHLLRAHSCIDGTDDEGLRNFAGPVVRYTDDCSVGDLVVCREKSFKLRRGDLVALALNELLDT
uniref:Uncharacterized protein n=1 Tax=Haptolina brevifila TaxID=156173 RepID=A0A7S2GRA4_9EUKA